MTTDEPVSSESSNRVREPLDEWLRSSRRYRRVTILLTKEDEYEVILCDFCGQAGIGYGPTIAEATANALNDAFARGS